MTRTLSRFTRLLTTAALILGAGCSGDENKIPGDQKAGPVAPVFLFLDVRASKAIITAGDFLRPIDITVEARFGDTGAPVANGTKVALTTTLGGFDQPGGPATLQLELFGGFGNAKYYPPQSGNGGTARLRVELQGVVDTTSITVRPFPEEAPPPEPEPEPEPAPVASTITLAASQTTASEDSATTDILVTATVIGSEAEPFGGAPVQFSSPTGSFASSGTSASKVKGTNSNGQVSDTLTVTGAELEALGGGSFNITATLFVEGGGTKAATVTITIIAGTPDAVPSNVILTTDTSSILDNGAGQVVNLSALVQDQFGAVFEGGTVTFTSSIPGASFSANPVDSNISGIAANVLTVSSSDVASHATNSFTITATLNLTSGTDTSTVTINIVRQPQADFSFSGTSFVVNFDDESTGGPASWAWDFDSDTSAGTDSAAQNPSFDFTANACLPSCDVKLTVSNAAGSSTVTKSIALPLP